MRPSAFQNLHLSIVKFDWVGGRGTRYLKVTLAQRQNHIVVVVGVKLSGLMGRNLHTEHAYTIVGKNLAEAVIKSQVYRPTRDGAIGWMMYVEIATWNLSMQGNREAAENQRREKRDADSPHRVSTVLENEREGRRPISDAGL